MKFRISLALNVVLVVVVAAQAWKQWGMSIGHFYYRKSVYGVVAGSISELDKGNTKLVRDALALIWESRDANQPIIDEAGEKLGVVVRNSQTESPSQRQ